LRASAFYYPADARFVESQVFIWTRNRAFGALFFWNLNASVKLTPRMALRKRQTRILVAVSALRRVSKSNTRRLQFFAGILCV